jgi:hypothetical protein
LNVTSSVFIAEVTWSGPQGIAMEATRATISCPQIVCDGPISVITET